VWRRARAHVRAITGVPIHAGKRCFSAERANASKKRPQEAILPWSELKQAVGSLITLTYRDLFSDGDFLELIPRIAESCRFGLYALGGRTT